MKKRQMPVYTWDTFRTSEAYKSQVHENTNLSVYQGRQGVERSVRDPRYDSCHVRFIVQSSRA